MAVAAPTTRSAHRSPGLLDWIVGAKSRFQRKEAIWGYIFLLPWLIGLIVFIVGPILASAYFSLTRNRCTHATAVGRPGKL